MTSPPLYSIVALGYKNRKTDGYMSKYPALVTSHIREVR